MRRRVMLFARALLSLLVALPGAAWAQGAAGFPSRTVTLVVPYVPGGLPDTVARVVGQKLSERWGQSVVIENKPGGNGVVAAQALAAKPTDGYTLLVTDGTMFTVNPFVYSNLAYDAQRDFTYISLTARAPLFLAVPPSLPASNFAEFVQLVKASPGKYSYGSSGIGSIHHLTFETIKSTLGLDIVHVPYKGTGQSIPAVVAGDVAAVWSAMPSIAGFAKEGKLKLIAVNSEKRSGLAPNIATVAETHIPGFDYAPIIGFIAQAGLAPAIAQKISADVAEVLRDKALAERMTVLGIEPVGSDPATFAAQIATDRERYARTIKAVGIKAN